MELKTKSSALATAVGLFAISLSAFAADAPKGSSGMAIGANDKVHCYGVHDCKGNSDCKTTDSACKGQNGCKGNGFKALTAKACLAADGTIADIKEKKKS